MLRWVMQRAVNSSFLYADRRGRKRLAVDSVGLDVLGDGFRRAEVNAFGVAAVAFQMEAQRPLVAVLVEVRDAQLAARLDVRAGIDIDLRMARSRSSTSAVPGTMATSF